MDRNTAFAAWASVLLGRRHARFTHERDAAVHCPLHERFTHLAGEVYEEAGRLRLCEGFEDPTCSFQWSFTTIEDHMVSGCREYLLRYVANFSFLSGTWVNAWGLRGAAARERVIELHDVILLLLYFSCSYFLQRQLLQRH